jgi:hypothetical protein
MLLETQHAVWRMECMPKLAWCGCAEGTRCWQLQHVRVPHKARLLLGVACADDQQATGCSCSGSLPIAGAGELHGCALVTATAAC